MNSVWNQGEWSRIVSWQHIYMHNNWFIDPRISDFESDCKRKQEKGSGADGSSAVVSVNILAALVYENTYTYSSNF